MKHSRHVALTFAVSALLTFSTVLLTAQEKPAGWNAARQEKQDQHGRTGERKMVRMAFDADKAVMIPEVGMVVAEDDGKLSVQFVPPKERRPKETAELDIRSGDEIGMAAGKRVSSAKLLREIYESVKTGEEIKLGLRRDGKSFIVEFNKKDEMDLPTRMIIRADDGDEPGRDILPALGIAIREKDGKLVITETFPNAPMEMTKGDIIRSVNGTRVKNLADFSGVYDKVEVGDTLKFGLLREGTKVTVVTTRNEMQERMIVK